MLTSRKTYHGFPFAHRQHMHPGHCRLIHGHNWDFTFEFACREVDSNGFVIDFGELGFIKQVLDNRFDHTLVLNQDDPMRPMLEECLLGPPENRLVDPLAKIIVVPNGSTEGLAEYLCNMIGKVVRERTFNRVWVTAVTVSENERNSSTYSDA